MQRPLRPLGPPPRALVGGAAPDFELTPALGGSSPVRLSSLLERGLPVVLVIYSDC